MDQAAHRQRENFPEVKSGGVATLVADARWAEKNLLKPMVRLVSHGVGAVEPALFGLVGFPL